jgi:hypothetical protein
VPSCCTGRESLERGAFTHQQHDVLLRDAPEHGLSVDLIRDQHRQTGNDDALLHKLEKVLVAGADHLQLRDGLGGLQ